MVFLPFLTKSRELFTETRYAFSTKERNSNSNKKDKTFVHIICLVRLQAVSNRARSRSLFALRSARILEQN